MLSHAERSGPHPLTAQKPLSSGVSHRRQRVERGGHGLTGVDEVGDDAFVHIQVPLVLAQIASVVTLRQHPPYLRPQAEGVRQKLEYDVAVAGAVAMPPQRRQA
jgi:hypothetical protein